MHFRLQSNVSSNIILIMITVYVHLTYFGQIPFEIFVLFSVHVMLTRAVLKMICTGFLAV